MIQLLSNLVDIIAKLLSFLVIVHVILSYFMSPYHPIRRTISGIIEPILSKIRRFLPSIQGIDFSPFILILIIQLAEIILINILRLFL